MTWCGKPILKDELTSKDKERIYVESNLDKSDECGAIPGQVLSARGAERVEDEQTKINLG